MGGTLERAETTPNALGVAVVGAGYWGPNLARNLLASDAFDLRWVIDRDEAKARRAVRAAPKVRVGVALAEALEDPNVQAVVIATPAASHAPLGLEALSAGRHVLMEKPLATSSEDGRRLVEEAARRSLVLMCDHTFCYTPAVEAIRDLVRSGDLGELLYIDSTRLNLGLVQPDVDVFWDLAPHDLSILDYVLPDDVRPTEVLAYGADPIGAGKSCVGYLTMPLTSQGVVHLSVNWLSPTKIRQMVIAGSKSMIVWDDMKPYQRLSLVDCGVALTREMDIDKEKLMVSYRMGDMVVPPLRETGEALASVVDEFASAITDGRPVRTDGASGLRILEVLEAAAVSIRADGASVRLRAR